MKICTSFLVCIVATGLVAFPSCKKINEFGTINIDPNLATEPVTSALLTNVLSGMGNALVWDQGALNTTAGLYSQYFSQTQYTELSRYAKFNFDFDGYYAGPLQDLQVIINYNTTVATAAKAEQFGSPENQIAIARILKAVYFKFMTDAFGDLPYFSALQGGSGQNAYDKQEQIYPAIIKELKEAAAALNLNAPIPVQGDVLFYGDLSRWKKFANSVRALAALNMAKANPALSKTEFADAVASGVIENTSDNATMYYPGGKFPNPFYNFYNLIQRKDYGVSEAVMDHLTNDPRRAAYASSPVGFPYGLPRDEAVAFGNANPNWARINTGALYKPDAPVTLVGAGSVWLARAEAAERGLTSEDKQTLYKTGIQRSMEEWGVYSDAAFADYIGANPPTDLVAIATQEWITAFPNGMEGWNVWRRTGFPNLNPAPGTTAIPRRMPYGPNEYNLNTSNVQTAAARYTVGGEADSQFAKIWWDQ